LTQKLLVLDLDETLVHTTTELVEEFDFKFEQPCNDNGAFITVYVRLRPFLDIFLEFMANYYEIAIFTAAQQEVAFGD
jgi:TFIIF-interacting CTD phosphatase-like protein